MVVIFICGEHVEGLGLLTLWVCTYSLGTIYKAGDYQMSTWIPFVWAVINVVFLILSSFSLQGGLL